MIGGLDLYTSYQDVNDTLKDWGAVECGTLNNDTHPESPRLIIGVRKWSWDNCGENGPDLSFLGLEMVSHVVVHHKYDLFIYR